MNVEDIFKSWIKTINPTEEQLQLAKERLDICNTCPSKQKGMGKMNICNLCNCPISYDEKPIGKTYSEKNDCPLHKWKS